MAQSAVTVRLDSNMKTQFVELCEQFGMSVNTAFNVFVKAVVMSKKIPFEIKASTKSAQMKGLDAFEQIRRMAESGQLPELTLDEINEEIGLARKARRR